MADYFELFSETIAAPSVAARDALRDAFEHHEDGALVNWREGYKEGAPVLHFWSDESCDLEVIAEVIQDWQKKYDVQEPFILGYAQTCSKPRSGEFGGGAVLIHKGEARWFHARRVARKAMDPKTDLRAQLKQARVLLRRIEPHLNKLTTPSESLILDIRNEIASWPDETSE